MSSDAPNAVEVRPSGQSTGRTPERVTDSRWSQVTEAHQTAREPLDFVEEARPHPRGSDLSYYADPSLRPPSSTAHNTGDNAHRGDTTMVPNTPAVPSEVHSSIVVRSLGYPISSDSVIVLPDLAVLDATQNTDIESRHPTREEVEESVRGLEEAMRTAELAHATMMPRSPYEADSQSDETAQQFLERSRRDSTLRYIDNQQDTRLLRHRDTAEMYRAVRAVNAAADASHGVIERSAMARHDLERALRDYRLARRALRNHYHSGEASDSPEQNTPTYSDVMAQIAEQQNNNRNRMRARGQSRSSPAIRRSDAIVSRLAAAAGIVDEAWRSEDEAQTVVGSPNTSSAQLRGITGTQENRGLRSTLPAGVSPTSELYLGPTTSRRSTTTLSGGMRDFYRRIEDRERHSSNLTSLSRRAGLSNTNFSSDTRSVVARAESNQALRSRINMDNSTNAADVLEARAQKPSYSTAKSRAKKTLRYLSDLKQFANNRGKASERVKEMGLHLHADGTTNNKLDLPLNINDLTRPEYSSWLEAGVSWKGIQASGLSRIDTAGTSSGSRSTNEELALRFPHADIERLRGLFAFRDRFTAREQRQSGEIQSPRTHQQASGHQDSHTESPSTSANTVSLLDRHRRLNDDWRESSRTNVSRIQAGSTEDIWPVSVNVHQVDWQNMTLTGSMVASQIPDRPRLNTTASDIGTSNATAESSMETLFDGEIIDFRKFEFETVAGKAGYKVGGPVIDLKYWSRIGPFKAVVEEQLRVASQKKEIEAYEKLGVHGTLEEQRVDYVNVFEESNNFAELDRDEIGTVVFNTMAECLGSRKWIEQVMGEGGWIFMRWKERCFIPLSTSEPSSAETSTFISPNEHTRLRTLAFRPAVVSPTGQTITYTTNYSEMTHPNQAAWGLTIQGFYYVALSRLTGHIEALYYDSASQPFQELVLHPVKKIVFCDDDDPEEEKEKGTTVGVRTEFPSWKFR